MSLGRSGEGKIIHRTNLTGSGFQRKRDTRDTVLTWTLLTLMDTLRFYLCILVKHLPWISILFQRIPSFLLSFPTLSYLNFEGTEGPSSRLTPERLGEGFGHADGFRWFPFQNWAAVGPKCWFGVLCLCWLWWTPTEADIPSLIQ